MCIYAPAPKQDNQHSADLHEAKEKTVTPSVVSYAQFLLEKLVFPTYTGI